MNTRSRGRTHTAQAVLLLLLLMPMLVRVAAFCSCCCCCSSAAKLCCHQDPRVLAELGRQGNMHVVSPVEGSPMLRGMKCVQLSIHHSLESENVLPNCHYSSPYWQ
jgi:hypothetical protein